MSLDLEVIADQISRAFWGESWHGPSVREVLSGVSAEDAAEAEIEGVVRKEEGKRRADRRGDKGKEIPG